MKNIFDPFDCEQPDELSHEIRVYLEDVDLDTALDGHLCRVLCLWYDSLDVTAQPDFLSSIRQFRERLKWERNSTRDFRSVAGIVRPLFEALVAANPDVLTAFPAEYTSESFVDLGYVPRRTDPLRYGFLNRVLSERKPSREWLLDYCDCDLPPRSPALINTAPEGFGAWLSLTSEEDRQVAHRITSDVRSRSDEDFNWIERFARTLVANYKEANANDPFCLLKLAILSVDLSWFPYNLRDEITRECCDHFIHNAALAPGLSVELAKVLVFCAIASPDSSDSTRPQRRMWLRLPEPVRHVLFEKLMDVNLYRQENGGLGLVGGKCFDDSVSCLREADLKRIHDPRFWLLRPDSDLYTDAIIDRLSKEPSEKKLVILHEIVACGRYSERVYLKLISVISELESEEERIDLLTALGAPNNLPDSARETLAAMISEIQGRISKLEIGAAKKALGLPRMNREAILKSDDLGLIYLGRMAQVAREPRYKDFEEDFRRQFDNASTNYPLEIFKRLANAMITAEMPFSDEDLSFCSDLTILHDHVMGMRHSDRLPGTWLTTRLFEWVLKTLPRAIRQERVGASGNSSFYPHRIDLHLADCRRAWAEFCWGKLDLKKEAKKKKPEELTPEDQIEPRVAWRIAHLKSLGDLGDDLGNKAHRRIHKIARTEMEHDDVRAVAEDVYNKTLRERMKSADNPIYSFIKVILWFRIANRTTLGLTIDKQAAIRTRNRELRLAKALYDRNQSTNT